MSHKANDIVADNKQDLRLEREPQTWYERNAEEQERREEYYDNSYEPTCGMSRPTWEY